MVRVHTVGSSVPRPVVHCFVCFLCVVLNKNRRCVLIKDWFDFRNHVCIVSCAIFDSCFSLNGRKCMKVISIVFWTSLYLKIDS